MENRKTYLHESVSVNENTNLTVTATVASNSSNAQLYGLKRGAVMLQPVLLVK
jgi:hypothetical protein